MTSSSSDPPPLYGRMMRAIRSGHSLGNTVRMLKLPLILTEDRLYAGAIAQFWFLTATLEKKLVEESKDPLVAKVLGMGLKCSPGYEADLEELSESNWREIAERTKTRATMDYCAHLESASAIELVAASFILYGALVIGGGRSTQAKVRKIFPRCSHQLFDVGSDMTELRKTFRRTFTEIGKDVTPEQYEELESQAAIFMGLNNTVIISISCWGKYASYLTAALASIAVLGFALCRGTLVKQQS